MSRLILRRLRGVAGTMLTWSVGGGLLGAVGFGGTATSLVVARRALAPAARADGLLPAGDGL